MKSPFDFVISPIGGRYNNIKKIGDKDLVLNTEIFNHQYANRRAKVISVPLIGETDIKPGDDVIVHHNVFRRWHDLKGKERNSRSYFNEDTYFIKHDQIFLYKRSWEWKVPKGYCFVKPIKSTDKFNTDVERSLMGIIKYPDEYLVKNGVNTGDLVGFRPSSEYEFIIDKERLYRILSNFITIKYEYQGDEETYNPSWAQSG